MDVSFVGSKTARILALELVRRQLNRGGSAAGLLCLQAGW